MVGFNDDAQDEIDSAAELYVEILEPLKDKIFFRSFKLEGTRFHRAIALISRRSFLREHLA